MKERKKILDVYAPDEDYTEPGPDPVRFFLKKPPWWHSGIKYGVLSLIILGLGFYGIRAFFLKALIEQSSQEIYAQIQAAHKALVELDPQAARISLVSVDSELRHVESSAGKFGVLELSSFWGKFMPRFDDLPGVFKQLIGISETAIDLSDDVAFLKEEALEYVLHQRGPELIARLRQFSQKLGTLSTQIDTLRGREDLLGMEVVRSLDSMDSELQELNTALLALVRFFDVPKDRHLLVLFQNSSEIRPGGGFIGSYADVTLNRGSLVDIEVVDIYDPDGWLELKIVPPEPLQRIVDSWEARDANWFFDYPASARQVIDLINSSLIYKERGVSFDGAIAINVHVIEDIIDLIEPLNLAEYDLSINAENFLEEVQREVEAGTDKARGEPKRILKVLTPMVLNRIANLQDSDKEILRERLAHHIDTRNLMAYINNPILEDYIQRIGWGGEVANLSALGGSDYLAIVNANIAGQKTDILIDQRIALDSVIQSDGHVENSLSLTRTHNGAGHTEWWYNATNKNYLQIYTSKGSTAKTVAGRDPWPAIPKRDYSSFEVDGDLAQIANSMQFLRDLGLEQFELFGKTVFAAWMNTAPGKSKTLDFEYETLADLPLESDGKYRFIFERQSGVPTSFEYNLLAPEGFIWKETGTDFFSYASDDPPGRLILTATLAPAP